MKLKTTMMFFLGGLTTILLAALVSLSCFIIYRDSVQDRLEELKHLSRDVASVRLVTHLSTDIDAIQKLSDTVNYVLTYVSVPSRRTVLSSTIDGTCAALSDAYAVWVHLFPGVLGDDMTGKRRFDTNPQTGQYSYYALHYQDKKEKTYLRPSTLAWADQAIKTTNLFLATYTHFRDTSM